MKTISFSSRELFLVISIFCDAEIFIDELVVNVGKWGIHRCNPSTFGAKLCCALIDNVETFCSRNFETVEFEYLLQSYEKFEYYLLFL